MRERGPGRSTVALLVWSVLALAMPAGVVWAHGGGVPRLTNVEAGPYWVSVWTQPDPLRVGQAHLTIAVSEPTASANGRQEAGPPILDANVQVQFRALGRVGETLLVQATHEGAANKLFYEADVELPETGQWEVHIDLEGPLGSGSVSFEAAVSPAQSTNWLWLGGIGLVAVAALWVVQRYRGQTG